MNLRSRPASRRLRCGLVRSAVFVWLWCSIGSDASRLIAQFGPQVPLWTGQVGGRAIQMADLDADGVKDIVSLANASLGILWLRMNADGTVAEFRRIPGMSPVLESAYFFDWDGDGDLDVLLWGRPAYEDQVAIYGAENLGQGYFAPYEVLLDQGWFSPPKAVADIDQDGDLDFFANSGFGNVWLNDGQGGFAPSPLLDGLPNISWDFLVFDADSDGDHDIVYEDEVHFVEQTDTGFFYHPEYVVGPHGTAHALDWDQDGDLDLVGYEVNTGGITISWCANDGNGVFEPRATLAQGAGNGNSVVNHCDWDGDGDQDILYHHSYALYALINTAGSLGAPVLLANSVALPEAIHGEDINADGAVDVLASNGYLGLYSLTRTGANSLGAPIRLNSLPQWAQHADFADLDGDGLWDMILAADAALGQQEPGSLLAWYRRTAQGDYGLPDTISAAHPALSKLSAVDFDGDGDADIVVLDSQQDGIYWFENDGTASNWVEHQISPGGPLQPILEVADLTEDGHLDILGMAMSGTIFMITNNGDGTFSGSTVWASSQVDQLELADIDNDGDLDLVTLGGTGITSYAHRLMNQGAGVFAPAEPITSATVNYGEAIHLLDAEGDGDLDMLVRVAIPMSWQLKENDGAGNFTSSTMSFPGVPGNVHVYDVADLNADGQPDFGVWYIDMFESVVLLSGPNGHEIAQNECFIDQDAIYNEFRDMDGDGDLDVVYHRYDGVGGIWAWENYWQHAYSAAGEVFLDEDQSGTREPDEPGLQAAVVSAPGSLWSYALGGEFRLALDTGSYQVALEPQNPLWYPTVGATGYAFSLSASDPMVDSLLFGLYPGPDSTLVAVAMASAPTRCDQTIIQDINLTNLGNTHAEGILSVGLDPSITFVESDPPPLSMANGVITWSIPSIGYFETQRVRMRCTMPSFQFIGAQLTTSMVFNSTDATGNPNGTFDSFWQGTLTCAYDPNDKQVSPPGVGDLGWIDSETAFLDYTVRFKNTGTDTALTVVVVDNLSQHLDPSTLQLLGASHALTGLSVEGDGTALFRFEGIMLPDSNVNEPMSHGYVQFRVHVRPGTPVGTVIPNSAGILFDLNPAVVTNTTYNTLVDCSSGQVQVVLSAPGIMASSAGLAYRWYRNGVLLLGAAQQLLVPAQSGAYTVEVLLPDGCWARSEAFWFGGAGVHERPMLAVMISPNPFGDELVMQASPGLMKGDELRLTDVLGRVVLRAICSGQGQQRVPAAQLSSGAYTVHVIRAGEIVAAVRAVKE